MSEMTISTIIPAYNRAPLISRAIASALLQLNHDDELIVIDDGSTDDTERVVARFGNRVRYIKTKNKGAGAARNHGIREAHKPLIAFLDSDDEWMPGKISLQRAYMNKRPDILFSFAHQAFRKKDGMEKRFSMQTWPGVDQSWEEIFGKGQYYSSIRSLPDGIDDFVVYSGSIYLQMLTGMYVSANTIMVRRKEAGDALHFAEDTKTYEDWECFGRLAGAGKCAYMDREMAWQHTHFGPRLTDASSLDSVTARMRIMQRVWGEDDLFLKNNKQLYLNVLNEQRFFKIGCLILNGKTKFATDEISQLPNCSLPYRIFAALPGCIAKPLARMLRNIRHINKQ